MFSIWGYSQRGKISYIEGKSFRDTSNFFPIILGVEKVTRRVVMMVDMKALRYKHILIGKVGKKRENLFEKTEICYKIMIVQ